MKSILHIFTLLALTVGATACIEDGFSTSPSSQPVPSCDTLKMGTLYTLEGSATHRMTLRNPGSKGLEIQNILLSGDAAQYFRLNVDGLSGTEFSNVEIRANDSIYIFVEATLPEMHSDTPQPVDAYLDITTNGVRRQVVISAEGQDVVSLRDTVIANDTTLAYARPVRVMGTLKVEAGATLTLAPGTTMLFHDKAMLAVAGRLVSQGTVERPVTLTGDRIDNVVGDIPFDLMSRQWEGVWFDSPDTQQLSHTIIKNTWYGVNLQQGRLEMVNCVLRNSGNTVLQAWPDTQVQAVGCELAEAPQGLVWLIGGKHLFNHCTFANYYLFAAIAGPMIQVDEWTEPHQPVSMEVTNSILYGLGSELWTGSLDDYDIYLRSCLLKSAGSDDGHFIGCLWDKDPLYYTVREDYIFDYRLQPESPAIGAADPSLTSPKAALDRYGRPRGDRPDLGAYVFVNEK